MRSSKRWWRRCASWWPPVVDQADLVGLLRDGVDAKGGRWADLGAGEGAFTMALADLLGPGADITAVDRDAGALRRLTGEMGQRFPAIRVETLVADFRKTLPLAGLDGVVMATSLHFLPDNHPVLASAKAMLRPPCTPIFPAHPSYPPSP